MIPVNAHVISPTEVPSLVSIEHAGELRMYSAGNVPVGLVVGLEVGLLVGLVVGLAVLVGLLVLAWLQIASVQKSSASLADCGHELRSW